jgi:probable F420-dependent oxidoreductase
MLSFGVCFIPLPPVRSLVQMTKLAEECGFEYAWLFDSPVIWQEIYSILGAMAANTTTINMGPCVTNPATRDLTVTASALATLNEISGGRIHCGIGRGDSARRVAGKHPVTVDELDHAIDAIRALTSGEEIIHEGTAVQLKWTSGPPPPIWVSAYGPKVLQSAGKHADGVILQPADISVMTWAMQHVFAGAKSAGRNPQEIQVMCAAPACVTDDIASACEQLRWWPAMLSNHATSVVSRYPASEVPPIFLEYIAARDKYDYGAHGHKGATHNAFVSDEVVERFSLIGPAEKCIEKLRELEAIGVHQFNLFTNGWEEAEGLIRKFGRDIIPAFGSA